MLVRNQPIFSRSKPTQKSDHRLSSKHYGEAHDAFMRCFNKLKQHGVPLSVINEAWRNVKEKDRAELHAFDEQLIAQQLPAVIDVIRGLVTENPQILWAEVREKMVAAGFQARVVGLAWNKAFYQDRKHLEPPKKTTVAEVLP